MLLLYVHSTPPAETEVGSHRALTKERRTDVFFVTQSTAATVLLSRAATEVNVLAPLIAGEDFSCTLPRAPHTRRGRLRKNTVCHRYVHTCRCASARTTRDAWRQRYMDDKRGGGTMRHKHLQQDQYSFASCASAALVFLF